MCIRDRLYTLLFKIKNQIITQIKSALDFLSIKEKAEFFPRFFKAGKGEYAEGDQFIGVTVPDQRKVAKEFWNKISLEELGELLSSKIHEHRHTALLMLVAKFEKSKDPKEKDEIVKFYLKNKIPVSYTHLDVYKRQLGKTTRRNWNAWTRRNRN